MQRRSDRKTETVEAASKRRRQTGVLSQTEFIHFDTRAALSAACVFCVGADDGVDVQLHSGHNNDGGHIDDTQTCTPEQTLYRRIEGEGRN